MKRWDWKGIDLVLVFVNSKQQPLEENATVAVLLEVLGMTQKRVAVEVNTELVTKNEWAQFKLKEGDRVEIVSFVGGG
jgi:thiamine biosynthesis protein ThiS